MASPEDAPRVTRFQPLVRCALVLSLGAALALRQRALLDNTLVTCGHDPVGSRQG